MRNQRSTSGDMWGSIVVSLILLVIWYSISALMGHPAAFQTAYTTGVISISIGSALVLIVLMLRS